ncbi:MAG TPA: pseudouridine synthase [Vicinamibacterales bacterium]|nr:pseudouridine synthase [Vicinamibacterales bacterium]
MQQRLQKLLSQAGIASRRAAEQLIADGRVSVNGRTIREMGVKADPSVDDVRVDGRRLKGAQRLRYVLLYKPAGYVTTRADPQRRRTVMDLLAGVREYVYPVGRLDYDSEGLLLLTNDGDLAAGLTHPRHGVERTYEARVAGIPSAEALDRLRHGIPLDGRRTLPADVVLLNPQRGPAKAGPYDRGDERRDAREGVLRITIREGRNRQVRRMCEAVGHPVRRLARTRIGTIADRQLKPGEWRELTDAEVRRLRDLASRPAPPTATPPRSRRAPRAAGPPRGGSAR